MAEEEFEYEYDDSGEEAAGSDAEFVYEDEPSAVSVAPLAPPPLVRAASETFDVLDADGLKLWMEEELNRVCETLGVSFSASLALMRHYQWDFSRLTEAYISDSKKV